MMRKVWSNIEEVPYATKIANFYLNWEFTEQYLQFEFTDGFEMKQKAWGSIEEVPCCFSRSSIKFQGQLGQKKFWFWPKLGVSGL